MRLVHLADLHLGFRQFQRLAKNGTNLRESDVARAFRDAIDQVIVLRPRLVVVAGDIFHASRPPNNAIVHALKQFMRLRAELADALIVVVAGNHDAPRTAETGNILALLEAVGVHVAAAGAKRIVLGDLSVLAVPDVAGVRPLLEPDPASRYNVLVVHGEAEYAAQSAPHRWDYVALGHYHVHREVAPRAFYSGSLDYTSSNIWGELAEERARGIPGKGFVVCDLDTRAHEFHPVPAARGFVDLPEIDARDQTPEAIDAAIGAAVEGCPGGIDAKVVRLVIREIPRTVTRALDQRPLRSYRARALNFQIVFHKPAEAFTIGGAAPARRRMTLTEIVRDTLMKRELPADLDRARLAELAEKYLDEAADHTERTTEAEPEEATV